LTKLRQSSACRRAIRQSQYFLTFWNPSHRRHTWMTNDSLGIVIKTFVSFRYGAFCYPDTSRVRSGSIVPDYGLVNRAIGVRSPAGAKDFSYSLFVQTSSGDHPASCTMGNGGPFPGAKERSGRDADHSPHLIPTSSMSRSYIHPFPPPKRLHGV
jgi:hypothetical protein